MTLIERLEAATGPDREIDIELARSTQPEGRRIEPDGTVLVSGDMGEGPGWFPVPVEVPAYTASLDAALTLVPEGYDWRVGEMTWASGLTRKPEATVFRPGAAQSIETAPTVISAATPALAMCIAALKCIAALNALAVIAAERHRSQK